MAHTRIDIPSLNTQLLLLRIDARGRVRTTRITSGGFPRASCRRRPRPWSSASATTSSSPTGIGACSERSSGTRPERRGQGSSSTPRSGSSRSARCSREAGPGRSMRPGRNRCSGSAPSRSRSRCAAAIRWRTSSSTRRSRPRSHCRRPAEVAANEWASVTELDLEDIEDLDPTGRIWAGTVVRGTSQVQVDGRIADTPRRRAAPANCCLRDPGASSGSGRRGRCPAHEHAGSPPGGRRQRVLDRIDRRRRGAAASRCIASAPA